MKLSEKCILFALDQFFTSHEDLKTWEHLQSNDFDDDFTENEILCELYQDQCFSNMFQLVQDVAESVQKFAVNNGLNLTNN